MTIEPTAASVKTSAAKQKKIDTVKNLTDKFSRAKSVVLADYRGIKHKQLEYLRKLLKKTDAELVVSKNSFLSRALGNQAKDLESSLKEATAALFAFADEVAPLKELLKFFKQVGLGKTKAGLLGKQVLSEEEVNKLATLPTKEVLLATLAARLKGPISGFHYGLRWNLQKLVTVLGNIKKSN